MKVALLSVILCAFAIYVDTAVTLPDFMKDKWEDETKKPQSVRLNGVTYTCVEKMSCDCPRLLCTGNSSCITETSTEKCQLYKLYKNIDLNNAKRPFFSKGDCGCVSI